MKMNDMLFILLLTIVNNIYCAAPVALLYKAAEGAVLLKESRQQSYPKVSQCITKDWRQHAVHRSATSYRLSQACSNNISSSPELLRQEMNQQIEQIEERQRKSVHSNNTVHTRNRLRGGVRTMSVAQVDQARVMRYNELKRIALASVYYLHEYSTITSAPADDVVVLYNANVIIKEILCVGSDCVARLCKTRELFNKSMVQNVWSIPIRLGKNPYTLYIVTPEFLYQWLISLLDQGNELTLFQKSLSSEAHVELKQITEFPAYKEFVVPIVSKVALMQQ